MYVCHNSIVNSSHKIIENIPAYIQINVLTPFGKSVYLKNTDSRMDDFKRGSPLNLHGIFYSADGESTFSCLEVMFMYHHEGIEFQGGETLATYRSIIN